MFHNSLGQTIWQILRQVNTYRDVDSLNKCGLPADGQRDYPRTGSILGGTGVVVLMWKVSTIGSKSKNESNKKIDHEFDKLGNAAYP